MTQSYIHASFNVNYLTAQICYIPLHFHYNHPHPHLQVSHHRSLCPES